MSWVRRQQGQLRLLAVGLELYSSDSRYSVRLQDSSDWQLRMRPLLETDQGHYECQVPSHPPLVHSVYLNVVGELAYFEITTCCLLHFSTVWLECTTTRILNTFTVYLISCSSENIRRRSQSIC